MKMPQNPLFCMAIFLQGTWQGYIYMSRFKYRQFYIEDSIFSINRKSVVIYSICEYSFKFALDLISGNSLVNKAHCYIKPREAISRITVLRIFNSIKIKKER
ncbi:hypothetical protein CLU79DRAFT_228430 [Phycomyces nitens]|nr:hypothetical protein CLU79DRAFT_228430 [Phycomyces nitens]